MLFLTSAFPCPPLLKAVDPPVKTYHALDPPVRGPHELHQGGLVVPPLSLQAGVSGILYQNGSGIKYLSFTSLLVGTCHNRAQG